MCMTQLPDGRWVPAQPLPYYRDTRSFWRKIWHSIRTIRIICIRDRKKREAADYKLENDMETFMVPVEPHTDEDGKWYSW